MAEPRVIHPVPMGPAGPKKKVEKVPKTLRFELTLQESTNLSCSEYSYLELLKKASENDEEKLKECMDPFAVQDLEEQKKLEELAKSFESRYGPHLSKKKRKVRIQDLIDLGDGYDDTDPFVDNSEAYDELVPVTLTTKLGGFYINTGVLDFREVSDSDGEFQSPKKKKKKMRVITSDSDSDVSATKKKKTLIIKKKHKDGTIIKEKKRKKLGISSGDDKPVIKKTKISKDKDLSVKKTVPNVAELIKQQATPTDVQPKEITQNGEGLGATPTGKGDSIFSTIDAVISRSVTDSPDSEGRTTPNPENPPLLPTGLPKPLEDIIKNIKQAALDSEKGKCKFFGSGVNRMLLCIEKESRQLPCHQRSGIYNHLAAFLPCSKETLLKRAKKLRLSEQDNKVRDPINKLKEAVNKVMPAFIEQYTQECQAAQTKSGEKVEGREDPGSSESDEENKDEKKKTFGPRKKFVFDKEVRELLCDIIRIKMMSYEMSKMRTQSAEEYLKTFLDTEIKPIWPKGWMQTRMLYKEARTAHAQWTVNCPKIKKSIIITGRITTSTSNSPTMTNSSITNSSKQMPKHKPVDNLNNLMTLLDYAEEEQESSINKEEVNDTASVLSSFLESEAANELLMSMSDNHVPMEDIEEKVTVVANVKNPPKPFTSSAASGAPTSGSSDSFMAQFQKFTGTYQAKPEASSNKPSVKAEPVKKVALPQHDVPQGRDLSKMKESLPVQHSSPVVSNTVKNIGAISSDFEQLSPPRAHYLSTSSTKTLQRSLSSDSSSLLKKPPAALNLNLGLGSSLTQKPNRDHQMASSSSIRRSSMDPVNKPSEPKPNSLGLFSPPPLSNPKDPMAIASILANAQAMASMASMTSHLASMSGQFPHPKSLLPDFRLPLTSEYPGKLPSDYPGKLPESMLQDTGSSLTKQHQQYLQKVTNIAQPLPIHLSSSSSTPSPAHQGQVSKSTNQWGVSKPSSHSYTTPPTSRSGFSIPLSRISPPSSIATGMPAGYKSISLLDQSKESALVHPGLQISRASGEAMRGPSAGYSHHSPGSSNHSPLGVGPVSPHGHSPKGLYPPLAHNSSPRHTLPTSPFAGQYPTDKSRSPHGY